MNNPKCCGMDSIWVDNVPGKEYFYCRECKKEVAPEPEKKRDPGPGWTLPESYLEIYKYYNIPFTFGQPKNREDA